MSHRMPLWSLVGLLLSAACSSGAPGGGDGDPAPWATAPEGPGKADTITEGYQVDGAKGWYLVGNALTAGDDEFHITLSTPPIARYVDAFVDDRPGVRMKKLGPGSFELSLDVRELAAGEHRVLLAQNHAKHAFAELHFVRSNPLYVFVSNDWDDADNENATLERQERLHADHPELRLTHFVGPYTFTDPTVPPERVEMLASWVKELRDDHGDEIGLHIHPYCNFVETTGVACRTQPSFAKAYGDTTGYTVILASYTKDEMKTLLQGADALFEAHGLGKPTSFRAGGWSAEPHTLAALSEDGFVADASPANWSHMEEWKDVWGASIYSWCQEHWSSIDDTSQPYYPNTDDMQSSQPPVLPLLELPDNGLLVDYVTAKEMIDVFHANFPGDALEKPTLLSIGYHPPNFSEEFWARIDGALDEIDRHLASRGEGPVVYATATELAKVWPAP
jgi:hypothetical protein